MSLILWGAAIVVFMIALLYPIECPVVTLTGKVDNDDVPKLRQMLADFETTTELQPLVIHHTRRDCERTGR